MDDDSLLIEDEEAHERAFANYAPATFQLVIAVGIGTVISWLLSKTGMTFPIYIGAMIAAAIIRNICEYTGILTIHMGEINDIGGIMLSLFLGIAMITLKIWQLAALALPLMLLLAAQTVFMFLYVRFVIFTATAKSETPAKATEHYSVESDNMAIPEIHTGKVVHKEKEKNKKLPDIQFDSLAIPEIHIKKKK